MSNNGNMNTDTHTHEALKIFDSCNEFKQRVLPASYYYLSALENMNVEHFACVRQSLSCFKYFFRLEKSANIKTTPFEVINDCK